MKKCKDGKQTAQCRTQTGGTCSADAVCTFIVASFTTQFNGGRLPYTELGYLHDTSMLYSEWIIIITNTVNIFTF